MTCQSFTVVHSLKGFDEETLRKIHNSPKDEFGITHANILYNREEGSFVSWMPQVKRQ